MCSRGVTQKHRHLMQDLYDLLPHCKKESKVEKKEAVEDLQDLCYQHTCSGLIFLEAQRGKDLYMWMTKAPRGPSIKFQVQGIKTSLELRMTGNNLKGSRPLLSFDSSFSSTSQEENKHLQLMKEVISQSFCTPRHHPKSKPFIDHIFSFSYYDG